MTIDVVAVIIIIMSSVIFFQVLAYVLHTAANQILLVRNMILNYVAALQRSQPVSIANADVEEINEDVGVDQSLVPVNGKYVACILINLTSVLLISFVVSSESCPCWSCRRGQSC